MQNKAILLIALFLSLFVGLASATEDSDAIDDLNNIDDALTGLEIVTEGSNDLQKLQEDPTNTTRLKEAIEKPFDIMFGGDIRNSDKVTKYMYGMIALAFISTIIPLIVTILKGIS